MPKIGGGNNLVSRLFTPLYEKGIKETQNRSMETTGLKELSNIKCQFNPATCPTQPLEFFGSIFAIHLSQHGLALKNML